MVEGEEKDVQMELEEVKEELDDQEELKGLEEEDLKSLPDT